MNAFVRRLAVLSVLWSLCELLLPDGKQQKMVRMTVSVLVMASLIGALGGLLHENATVPTAVELQPAKAVMAVGENTYKHIALRSVANQAQALCERMANRAGYNAGATVYVNQDGSLDHIELQISGGNSAPLLSPDELTSRIAERLAVDASQIWLKEAAEEMSP